MPEQTTRLNKYIAQHLGIGRRAADDLIQQGRVQINGTPVPLGARVVPGDKITVNGKRITSAGNHTLQYILINKPTGYVCSRHQQGSTPTIYTLVPPQYQHLKTVGRLDKDSSGLLLLTNDGDLAHRLTHPSFKKIKKYEVTLNKPLQPLHRQMINDFGIDLPDGKSKLLLERLHSDDHTWLVTVHQGRNRQIRRTFAALDYQVTRLHRIQFGPWTIDELRGRPIAPTIPPHLAV